MWLIALLGCGSAVDGFLVDRDLAICGRHARCESLEAAGYTDEAECLDTLAASTEAAHGENTLGCGTFDAAAADACLAAYDAACDVVPDLTECDAVCR